MNVDTHQFPQETQTETVSPGQLNLAIQEIARDLAFGTISPREAAAIVLQLKLKEQENDRYGIPTYWKPNLEVRPKNYPSLLSGIRR